MGRTAGLLIHWSQRQQAGGALPGMQGHRCKRVEVGEGGGRHGAKPVVPTTVNSSEIGMGAMKSGLAMEYASTIRKEEFWVMHPYMVRYPNHPMCLTYHTVRDSLSVFQAMT